jgi:hypothetical protein
MNGKVMRWGSKSRSLGISINEQYFISDDGKFYIPIKVNVNILHKLSLSTKNDFKGNITLRYLNGFINETKPVTLTSNYLNSRLNSGTDYYFWEKAKNELSNSNTLAVNKLQDEFNNNFQKETKKEFNEKLDNEQIEIIDSIADGYSEYVGDLEEINSELIKQLVDLQKEKVKLINQMDVLMKKNVGSNKELQIQIEGLKSESKQLESTIEGLKKTIDSNTKATTKLRKESVTEKEVVNPIVISSVENKVTDSEVIREAENKVINSVVISDAGNEKDEE